MKAETIAKAVNAACESIGCAPEWTEDEIGTLVSEVRCGNHHSPLSVHAVLHASAGQRANAAVTVTLAICSALAKLPDLPEAQTEEAQAEAPAQQEPVQEQQPIREEASNGAEEQPAE